ncbi:hypothetical protein WJX72_003267 [[Myrmecia] bisecta]|uniref:Uncharacterized protein n=1 Tax=[Myrmecia] bisecta TaxID=41462 RepID=A0AAW1P9T5_9CHLO
MSRSEDLEEGEIEEGEIQIEKELPKPPPPARPPPVPPPSHVLSNRRPSYPSHPGDEGFGLPGPPAFPRGARSPGFIPTGPPFGDMRPTPPGPPRSWGFHERERDRHGARGGRGSPWLPPPDWLGGPPRLERDGERDVQERGLPLPRGLPHADSADLRTREAPARRSQRSPSVAGEREEGEQLENGQTRRRGSADVEDGEQLSAAQQAQREREVKELCDAIKRLTAKEWVAEAIKTLEPVCRDLKTALRKHYSLYKVLKKGAQASSEDQSAELSQMGARVFKGLHALHIVSTTGVGRTQDMTAAKEVMRSALRDRKALFTPVQQQDLENWFKTSKIWAPEHDVKPAKAAVMLMSPAQSAGSVLSSRCSRPPLQPMDIQ